MLIPILTDAASTMTKGAAKVAETDPHGFTLTVISVCVVFAGLIVLYGVYSLSGAIFSGKFRKKGAEGAEKAAASGAAGAGAESAEAPGEVAAALALALRLHGAQGAAGHAQSAAGAAPRVITITPSQSPWADKSLTFRKTPSSR